MSENALDPRSRPSVLLLGGDQIYADDVAATLTSHISSLSWELCHVAEELPGTDAQVDDFRRKCKKAGPLGLRDALGFTSRESENHLLSFGDWAAMYVLAWSRDAWPSESTARSGRLEWQVPGSKTELEALKLTWDALHGVQRVLANLSTYMIFDDHEITDDWNITDEWTGRVKRNQAGYRVIANGLAAYWAFQAWGNDPDSFGADEFIAPITRHLYPTESLTDQQRKERAKTFEDLLWARHWEFAAPLSQRLVFMDTRTRRDPGVGQESRTPTPAPRLVKDEGWTALDALVENGQAPLVLVAPGPIYNLDAIEGRQIEAGSSSESDFYRWDVEAWRSNKRNIWDFLSHAIKWRPSMCVVLSGDVHYASAASILITAGGESVPVAQFTSSALKNEPNRLGLGAATLGSSRELVVSWWETTLGTVETATKLIQDATYHEFIAMEPTNRNLRTSGPRYVSESNVLALEVSATRFKAQLLVRRGAGRLERSLLQSDYSLSEWPAAALRNRPQQAVEPRRGLLDRKAMP